MRNFARRLIDYEASGAISGQTKAAAAYHVCEKLRTPLAALVGNGGFRALLARALTLATAEVPGLHGIHVKPDGSLDGVEDLHAQLDPHKYFEGGGVLLAQLLGLLAAFIGENLTLRLVREVWPKAPFNDLDFVNQNENEKSK
jgi:hypothetical protein